MAFTTPKTWSVGETLTSGNFNTHIRDNFNAMGPHLIARKTSDQSQGTGGMADDSQLILPVLANEIWHIRLFLYITTNVAAVAWNGPTGTTLAIQTHLGTSHATYTTLHGNFATPTGAILLEGLVFVGGTAGNVVHEFQGSGGTTTVKANSTLWAVKLA